MKGAHVQQRDANLFMRALHAQMSNLCERLLRAAAITKLITQLISDGVKHSNSHWVRHTIIDQCSDL